MNLPKYKTSFSAKIYKISGAEIDKYLSLASLDKIKELVPKEVNLEQNPDLLVVVGNTAVGNRMNLNHDCVSNSTAVDIAKNFIWKFVDLDHNRKTVIGVICNTGFSVFDSNKLLTEEEAIKTEEPVNISIALFLYKSVLNKELLELIEESCDESSSNYQCLSLSWELYFDNYDIAVGPDRNLSTAKVYKEEKEKENLEKYLPSNQGTGKLDNQLVYRVITGNYIIPAGIGIVKTPAADVKGILVVEQEKEILTTESKQQNIEKLQENEKTISQSANLYVTTNREHMEIKELKDINDDNLKEAKASQVHNFVVKEIEKASEKWLIEKTEKEAAITEAKKKYDEVIAKNTETEKQLTEVSKQLSDIKLQVEAREKQDKFNSRMAELEEIFAIDDAARKVIASAVNGLSDEDYGKYKGQLTVLMKGKEKTKEAIASVQAAVEDAVKTGQPKEEPITKSQQQITETMKEKFANAFGRENTIIEINGRKQV